MQDNPSREVMLAQEQAVIRRGPGLRKGVEAAFGAGGGSEGTLVLTDQRLLYVHGDEKEEDLRVGAMSAKRLYFSDVEDLDAMPLDSESLEIPLRSVVKVTGHRLETMAPKLVVDWTDGSGRHSAEFVQQITGGSRRKNLDDWAKVIEMLKANRLKIMPLPPAPGADTLEGKVMAVLGDMQEKGPLVIQEEVEEHYKLDLDPDEVEAACDRLVAAGLARKTTPPGEDPYYRKVSSLGDYDLSG